MAVDLKAEEITEIIRQQLSGISRGVDVSEVGTVTSGGDGICRVYGLACVMAGGEGSGAGGIIAGPAGQAMTGRVVNALGQPIDGKGPINTTEFYPIER